MLSKFLYLALTVAPFLIGCVIYDMWLKRTGRDIVSQAKRDLKAHYPYYKG